MSPFQIVLVCVFSLELVIRLFLTGKTVEVKPAPFTLLVYAFLLAGCVLWL